MKLTRFRNNYMLIKNLLIILIYNIIINSIAITRASKFLLQWVLFNKRYSRNRGSIDLRAQMGDRYTKINPAMHNQFDTAETANM